MKMYGNWFIRVAVGIALGVGVILALIVRTGAGSREKERVVVELLDECEPKSFNAALGRVACNPAFDGEVTFAEFIQELQRTRRVEAWTFDPDQIDEDAGVTVALINRGGETHTFTRVAEFGGGFVPVLNALSGNPTPRPECAIVLGNGDLAPQPPSATNIFVPAGGTAPAGALQAGVSRFQCCIHPWMRTTATIESKR